MRQDVEGEALIPIEAFYTRRDQFDDARRVAELADQRPAAIALLDRA